MSLPVFPADAVFQLVVDDERQVLLYDEQAVQVQRHVVEPPLRLQHRRNDLHRVLDLVPELLDHLREIRPVLGHAFLENGVHFLPIGHRRAVVGLEHVDVAVVVGVNALAGEAAVDVEDDAESALKPDLLHAGDDLVVRNEDLPH